MPHISHSRFYIALALITSFLDASATASPLKSHSVSFGKWVAVPWTREGDIGSPHYQPLTLKVRPLLVDARVKEFTLGQPHDITDRLFVVQGAFRVNDSLPQESNSAAHWQWQSGGWLLVDRVTGHIAPTSLPDFDGLYSAVSWYRDYAAYCGVSEDGKKIFAIVAQIGRRKAILRKLLGDQAPGSAEKKEASSNSVCSAPAWQRNPTEVIFEPAGSPKQAFAIRGHIVDMIYESGEVEEEEASK